MEKALKSKKLYLLLSVVFVAILVAGLAACSSPSSSSSSSSTTTEPKQEVQTPDADKYGVVDAASWKDIYPDEYATYEENLENSPAGKPSYLEEYPFLSVLYAGNAFSKGYNEAAGHPYSLESVANTPRIGEKTLSNCITCKTPQFTALVNENGVSEYSKPFAEMIGEFDEPISCYNCHENDPTTLTVGNQFFVTALGSDVKTAPEAAQVCGQCHNEYYFDPETKATTNPYTGLKAMAPESILAYYDEMGFSDWLYPVTETPMIKIQHPEFETVYGGGTESHMAGLGYTCSDCHMGTMTNSDGEEYTSHNWVSPLENQELLDSKCKSCHSDLKSQVAGWQSTYQERINTIGNKIADLATKMTDQVNAGTLSGDQLAALQKLHRSSQLYFDFCFVENSDGAHNPSLTKATLDKAEAAVDQALAML